MSHSLRTYQVTGDGNCLFRSFSYTITGRQAYYKNIRQKIVAHMLKIESALQPHIKSSAYDYLARSGMRNDRVWGTDIEILSASSLLNTDIYVYSKFGEAFRWSKFSQTMLNQSAPENKTAIYIQNITGVHYDVVLAVTSTDTQTYHNNSHNLTDHSVDKILTLEKQCVKNIEVEEDPLSKLKVELNSIGLNPLDIGGGGDCFFMQFRIKFVRIQSTTWKFVWQALITLKSILNNLLKVYQMHHGLNTYSTCLLQVVGVMVL